MIRLVKTSSLTHHHFCFSFYYINLSSILSLFEWIINLVILNESVLHIEILNKKQVTSPVLRDDMFILPHYTKNGYWHEAVRVARARGISRITVAKTNFSYSIIGCNCCIKCTYHTPHHSLHIDCLN